MKRKIVCLIIAAIISSLLCFSSCDDRTPASMVIINGTIWDGDFSGKDVIARMTAIVNIEYRPRCRTCEFRYLCGGGCPVGLFSIADNPNAPAHVKEYTEEIACAVSKTVLSELVWGMAENVSIKQENSPETYELSM